MEQLTFFDLQNDPSKGSFCDGEEKLSEMEALLLVQKEVGAQEVREAYTRMQAPDAYSLSQGECTDRPTLTLDELIAHVSAVRKKRLEGVDLSEVILPGLPEKEEAQELALEKKEERLPVKRKEQTEEKTGIVAFAKREAKRFFSGSYRWFDGTKPTENSGKRFPVSAFAAIGVLALCLTLIVGGSILVNHGETVNNKLKKELSQINLQIEELQSDLHLTNDVLLIRELAQNECGMIGEEYVRTETLSIGDGESVETYPDGKPTGVGLSTLLSAIGIKK